MAAKFGTVFRYYREKAGMYAAEAARIAGLDETYFRSIERNEKGPPRFAIVQRMIKSIGLKNKSVIRKLETLARARKDWRDNKPYKIEQRPMTFGAKLRRLRRDKSYEMGVVAKQIGITSQYLRNIEFDRALPPRRPMVARILKAIDCSFHLEEMMIVASKSRELVNIPACGLSDEDVKIIMGIAAMIDAKFLPEDLRSSLLLLIRYFDAKNAENTEVKTDVPMAIRQQEEGQGRGEPDLPSQNHEGDLVLAGEGNTSTQ